jgi:hypothetical protein
MNGFPEVVANRGKKSMKNGLPQRLVETGSFGY